MQITPKKTVTSVLAKFQKAYDDLAVLADKHQREADDLKAKAEFEQGEADRAIRVSLRIKDILE